MLGDLGRLARHPNWLIYLAMEQHIDDTGKELVAGLVNGVRRGPYVYCEDHCKFLQTWFAAGVQKQKHLEEHLEKQKLFFKEHSLAFEGAVAQRRLSCYP